MKQQSREEQFFVSTEEPEDIQVVRTTNEFIYGHHGKRYIDFNAGWCPTLRILGLAIGIEVSDS
jgi:hypothetical protein